MAVRIALLSDTHGYLDDRMLRLMQSCDEIWHAGDIGTTSVSDRLAQLKPLRAVYGNIDGTALRTSFPPVNRFMIEGLNVLMTHIGGYPGHYDRNIYPLLKTETPGLFVDGHSHILRVQYDQALKMLFMNPGAAGKQGFHHMRTMVRFTIDSGLVRDLEAIELGPRGLLPGEEGSTPF